MFSPVFLRERNLTYYVENFEEAKNFNIIDIHTKLCILIIIIVMKKFRAYGEKMKKIHSKISFVSDFLKNS